MIVTRHIPEWKDKPECKTCSFLEIKHINSTDYQGKDIKVPYFRCHLEPQPTNIDDPENWCSHWQKATIPPLPEE